MKAEDEVLNVSFYRGRGAGEGIDRARVAEDPGVFFTDGVIADGARRVAKEFLEQHRRAEIFDDVAGEVGFSEVGGEDRN